MNEPLAALPEALGRESPIHRYLQRVHDEISTLRGGAIADYIPELTKANPDWLGIAIATVDGQIYSVGDAQQRFTIQSVSKPFVYGDALFRRNQEEVLRHVGVEPTGEAFNSIVLDDRNNRPFNPMVNAGALAATELIHGDDAGEREEAMRAIFDRFAGRRLTIDEAVYESEKATGHRNRAIAYMMLNSGMITADPEALLDLYFRQCSLLVDAQDLAVMAATLANDGINPCTDQIVIAPDNVRDVLTVMNSCGMYNYAGQWAFEVGMPAKSGVSGAIIAVIPGQLGLAVYSPRVDEHGNSVRGIAFCQRFAEEYGLHAFQNRTNVRAVIRREYRGGQVQSKRLRAPAERKVLEAKGGSIAIVELQGALYFGSIERLVRRLGLADDSRYVILDFRHVHLVDGAALRLLHHIIADYAASERQILLSHLSLDANPGVYHAMEPLVASTGLMLMADSNAALEWCENALLSQVSATPKPKFALAELDLFRGLDRDDLRLVEQIVQPMHFAQGERVIREGTPAKLFFVIASGTVSIMLNVASETRQRKVASMGPGLSFGEMALLDGGRRSAEVVANERVLLYGLSVSELKRLSENRPQILITIYGNMVREFSERLRAANEEIRALD